MIKIFANQSKYQNKLKIYECNQCGLISMSNTPVQQCDRCKSNAFTISDDAIMHVGSQNTYKIGLDYHGVIDTYPEIFVPLALSILRSGGEVHIITGKPWTDTFNQTLLAYNHGEKWWTHYFSIDDYLQNHKRLPYTTDARGDRWYDLAAWNSAKGEYCKDQQINLHFDDSDVYCNFFETPYYHIRNFKLTKR